MGQLPMGLGMVPMAGTAPVEPAPMLEPCMMGDVAACVCSETGTQGQKMCQHDPASPTMGSFGPCESCLAPDAGTASDAAVCVPADCPPPATGQACCTQQGRCGTSVAMGPCA